MQPQLTLSTIQVVQPLFRGTEEGFWAESRHPLRGLRAPWSDPPTHCLRSLLPLSQCRVNGKRLASEATLWPPTKRRWSVPGKSVDSSETEFIATRACPTVHPLQVQTASCRHWNPSRGAEFATHCSMVGHVQARIPLTSTLMEKTLRILTKMHSYSIEAQLPRYVICSELPTPSQLLNQSYIMIDMDISIIMCDSNVRERECR